MTSDNRDDHAFGVKMTSGKVIWVAADSVDCIDGALIFRVEAGAEPRVVAGFNLDKVEHFGRPDAFRSQPD